MNPASTERTIEPGRIAARSVLPLTPRSQARSAIGQLRDENRCFHRIPRVLGALGGSTRAGRPPVCQLTGAGDTAAFRRGGGAVHRLSNTG
jgi:hypothetical protein